jgi:hypothetical protein
MKINLIISAFLSALIMQANAQTIPNAGFENWTMQPGGYEDPTDWKTNNDTNQNSISVTKTTDSYFGNYALQVINNFHHIDPGPLPGVATIMLYRDTCIVNTISAYVKCDSVSGTGKGIIGVYGWLGGLSQYLAVWETNIEIPQYALIDIPLSPLAIFDSIQIEIVGFAQTDAVGVATGYAMLKVDDMSEEISSDIQESDLSKSFKFSPNPFIDFAIVTFENPKAAKCILTIYDSKGNVVQIIDKIDNGQIKIERNNLPDGIYSFQVHSESIFIGAGKFVLQKAD